MERTKSLEWDESNILGRGSDGTIVFSGRFNERPVAVKRVLLTNTQLVARELEALYKCSHSRIVQLLCVEKDEPFLRLALELCDGTLADYCKGTYQGIMPGEMEAIKQMLEGLAFIHLQRYVHRDIKPNNILITQSAGLKIADFGFCKPVQHIESFSMSVAGIGTTGWMAPELLKSCVEVENGRKAAPTATAAIDVFSLGCVIYFFVTRGVHPFGVGPLRNRNILQGRYDISKLQKRDILRGIVKEMINDDPNNRPTLDDVLKRPIFNASTNSTELLKDDTKFNLWLKNLRNRFAGTAKSANSRRSSKAIMTTDELDSSMNLSNRPNTFATSLSVQPILQIVEEEGNLDTVSGLKASTSRPKTPSTLSRSQVWSAPVFFSRTLPRGQSKRKFVSEYIADHDERNSTNSPRLRSVTSLTDLEHGLSEEIGSNSALHSRPQTCSSTLSLSY